MIILYCDDVLVHSGLPDQSVASGTHKNSNPKKGWDI